MDKIVRKFGSSKSRQREGLGSGTRKPLGTSHLTLNKSVSTGGNNTTKFGVHNLQINKIVKDLRENIEQRTKDSEAKANLKSYLKKNKPKHAQGRNNAHKVVRSKHQQLLNLYKKPAASKGEFSRNSNYNFHTIDRARDVQQLQQNLDEKFKAVRRNEALVLNRDPVYQDYNSVIEFKPQKLERVGYNILLYTILKCTIKIKLVVSRLTLLFSLTERLQRMKLILTKAEKNTVEIYSLEVLI